MLCVFYRVISKKDMFDTHNLFNFSLDWMVYFLQLTQVNNCQQCTLFSSERIQWAQCEDCLKWRKLPACALLPSKWTCSDNSWDPERYESDPFSCKHILPRVGQDWLGEMSGCSVLEFDDLFHFHAHLHKAHH